MHRRIQRAKHESSDPALIDAAIASGVVLLFASESLFILNLLINTEPLQ